MPIGCALSSFMAPSGMCMLFWTSHLPLTDYRIVIAATLTIYIVTGLRIIKKRSELRSFSRLSREIPIASNLDAAEESHSIRSSPVSGNKNIIVTTQIKYDVQQDQSTLCESHDGDNHSINSSTRIISNPKARVEEAITMPPATAPAAISYNLGRGSNESSSIDNAQNGYRATAFAANPASESPMLRRDSIHTGRHRGRVADGNAAAMAYFNVAFLMFVALFVVWVPSTVNRLYSFVNKDSFNYGLNLVSAVVLPLQGAWNAIIYIFTTRAECRRAYGLTVAKFTGKEPPYQPHLSRKDSMTNSRNTRDSEGEYTLDDILKQGGRVNEPSC